MSDDTILLKNARLIDGVLDHAIENANVIIEGKYIREVSEREIKPGTARPFFLAHFVRSDIT